jgi:hypothetical protein
MKIRTLTDEDLTVKLKIGSTDQLISRLSKEQKLVQQSTDQQHNL